MELYHCPAARSFRVVWLMEEMGISDQCKLITMPFPPRIFYRPYLKVNVLGTIPCLIDGTTKMTESCAIPQYLASKFGPTPLTVRPEEPEYGEYLNWCHHADATLTFPQTVVLRYSKQEPGRADAAAEDYGKWYIARLRMLDNALEDGREFLVAGRFTIADILVAYALFLGTTLELDGRYKPQTRAYMERMMARPGWAAAEAREEKSAEEFDEAQEALEAQSKL